MNSKLFHTTLLSLVPLLLLTPSSSSQPCNSTCGALSIHYPFGTGTGCGSPAFQPHVTCSSSAAAANPSLIFSTHSGTYPIQSIDYTNQILYIQDPSMSTCTTTNVTSLGFSLDWAAPFTFASGNIFALFDCCTSSSSPLYNSNTTLCDTFNAPVCSLLYSCPAIRALNVPISTCCIYTPASLGPAFEMDLKKLQCTSYAGVYSFGGDETYPEGWMFGIAIKYRFSVDDGYPSACADCEKSNGVCGYAAAGEGNSFTCYCVNGMNTSTNCYYATMSWNHVIRVDVSSWIGILLIALWWALL